MPGSTWEGATNVEILAAIREALGGPPQIGALYRITYGQGLAMEPGSAIMEFMGFTTDRIAGGAEPALTFAVRNPVLPLTAPFGTTAHPLVLWPLDIIHISPARPGDLDVAMQYRQEGDTQTLRFAPGIPPTQ